MAEAGFPKTAEEVVATLAEIYRHQGQAEIAELLEGSSARIEQTDYDNWNGGTYIYSLALDIPVRVFASVEPKLKVIEGSISEKLAKAYANLGNHFLNSTTITPLAPKSTSIVSRAKPADSDVMHIWKEGCFRLFLSHVSAHKVAVGELKKELLLYGVSAFVAHEDITPSSEWQIEIELALRSMHGLSALLTPDFHASWWTDQEIGFALGRGVHVVSIRLGADPYGFIGKLQGLPAKLDDLASVARPLATTLLNHATTHREMKRSLVSALARAESFNNAIALSEIIQTVTDFTVDEKASLQRACEENYQVYRATGVVSRVHSAIGAPLPKKAVPDDDIPF